MPLACEGLQRSSYRIQSASISLLQCAMRKAASCRSLSTLVTNHADANFTPELETI